MGSSASHASSPPPPPPGPYAPPPPFGTAEAAADAPQKPREEEVAKEKVDYLNLPCPVPFEEIQREAFMALKPDLFEGMRFDFTKMISPYFALSHSVSMGSMEIPAQGSEVIKIPTSNYEFGANFINPKMMLMGRVSHEGRENIRVKYDISENLAVKINAQSVTKNLSLGTDVFWLGQQRKSGVGVVARYDTKK